MIDIQIRQGIVVANSSTGATNEKRLVYGLHCTTHTSIPTLEWQGLVNPA
ncbi:hypothetical protein O3P16_02375 [Chitinophagaceae bacterium LY-5]|uniref:Uncharacterized protein n=1 Tax=Polluticaenibacter yanchengensis TaxID=3014562 RepID=A0ABT4UFN7_9BACT|nr:hypothetical protein [Chitinophagaceae bacterium LY-5]